MKIKKASWFCTQVGAREHYAIPRALHAKNVLGGLVTDFWAGSLTRKASTVCPNNVIKSLAARSHADIPDYLIHSWNARAIIWDRQIKVMTSPDDVTGRYLGYNKTGKKFANAVVSHMKKCSVLPEGNVFFGYDTASLEAMRYFKEHGGVTVLDQIDPCRVEIEMVRKEQEVWPGWQNYDLDVPEEFYQRHHDEWALADRIVINSEFSRDALIKQGVEPAKLCVIPLSYESDIRPELKSNLAKRLPASGFTRQQPLHVLFLGQVMLRKGIQYLVKAAELLKEDPVIIDVVGPIHISDKAVASALDNVCFHGRVTRDEIGDWYHNSHVFILPTLSDGFAITQIEAMAHAMPVIATENCGQVVTDGVDGFIVADRDPDAIARKICHYLENPDTLHSHGNAALTKSGMFSLNRVGDALVTLEQEIYGNSFLSTSTC